MRDMRISMANGEVSMLDITCLKGHEVSAFCHVIGRMDSDNPFYIPCDINEIFPIEIECICGTTYTLDSKEMIPIKSHRCECGTYLIKYEFHTIQ